MAKKQDNAAQDFVGFFKNDPKALSNLKKMKDAQNPNEKPDIADGTYVARLTATQTQFNKVPRIILSFVVHRGAYEGTALRKEYMLGQISSKSTMTDEEIFNLCAVDMVTLGVDHDCFSDGEKFKEGIAELGKRKPLVRIGVKTNANGYLKIYVNGVVDEDDSDTDDQEDAEDQEDSGEEDQDSEGSDGTDEAPDNPVEVGDRVRFQPKGGRKATYSVTKSDEDDRICDLKDVTGKVVKNVPWSDIEFVVS